MDKEIVEISNENVGVPLGTVTKTVTKTVTICNGKKTVIRMHPKQTEGIRVPNNGGHVHHADDDDDDDHDNDGDGGDDSGSTTDEDDDHEYEYEEQDDYTETDDAIEERDATNTENGSDIASNETQKDCAARAKEHLRLHFQQVATHHGGHCKIAHLKAHGHGIKTLNVSAPGVETKVITETVHSE